MFESLLLLCVLIPIIPISWHTFSAENAIFSMGFSENFRISEEKYDFCHSVNVKEFQEMLTLRVTFPEVKIALHSIENMKTFTIENI